MEERFSSFLKQNFSGRSFPSGLFLPNSNFINFNIFNCFHLSFLPILVIFQLIIVTIVSIHRHGQFGVTFCLFGFLKTFCFGISPFLKLCLELIFAWTLFFCSVSASMIIFVSGRNYNIGILCRTFSFSSCCFSFCSVSKIFWSTLNRLYFSGQPLLFSVLLLLFHVF